MNRVIDPREREKSYAEVEQVDFYAQALKASEQFRDQYKGAAKPTKGAVDERSRLEPPLGCQFGEPSMTAIDYEAEYNNRRRVPGHGSPSPGE